MSTVEKLVIELSNGKAKNFYVFTGSRWKIDKMIQRIDGEAITIHSLEELWRHVHNKPLFGMQSRTFVMYECKEIMECKKYSISDIRAAIGDNTLILVYEKLNKVAKFTKQVTKYLTDFTENDRYDLIGVLKRRFPNIDKSVANMLLNRVDWNEELLHVEMDKLDSLPKHVEITTQLISDIVPQQKKDSLFAFIDALSNKYGASAFSYYPDIQQESPIKVISLLYTRFKQLFILQYYPTLDDTALSEQTGISKFHINLVRPSVGVFPTDRLNELILEIQKMEVRIKTGEIDGVLGLDILIVEILK